MRSFRDTCMDYFLGCGMSWKITAKKDKDIAIWVNRTKEIPRDIDVRIHLAEEDNIGILVYGIGSVRNQERFYEKVNEVNCRYRKYRIFINKDGEVMLRMDSNVSSKQLLYRNVMAGIQIVKNVYQEFVEKPLERKRHIRANTVSELLKAISFLEDEARIGFSLGRNVYHGLHTRYGGYRKEIRQFRDAFGFMPDNDVTFYKQAVYIYDEVESTQAFELFPAAYEKCGTGETVVYTAGELLYTLEAIREKGAENTLILTPDHNFELKKETTQGVCLAYMEEPDSKGQWLIFEL